MSTQSAPAELNPPMQIRNMDPDVYRAMRIEVASERGLTFSELVVRMWQAYEAAKARGEEPVVRLH